MIGLNNISCLSNTGTLVVPCQVLFVPRLSVDFGRIQSMEKRERNFPVPVEMVA